MITVHDPQKKNSNYMSRVLSAENGRPIRLRVAAAKCVNVMRLSRGGHTISLQIMDAAAAQTVSNTDDAVRGATAAKNPTWFHNTLEPAKMDSMFRAALNQTTQMMTVLVSDVKEPSIYVDGVLVPSIEESGLAAGNVIHIDIEAQGLFFYPHKFGVRWIVRRLYIATGALEDPSDDWAECEKLHVESFWRQDVDAVKTSIDESIEALVDKIGALEELKTVLDVDLAAAEACPAIGGAWQGHLDSLSAKCTKYIGGNI